MDKLATQYVDLPDVRIAYCEHGNGPTLLLLHGNSESKRIFSGYQTVHFNMFRTIAMDSRGHGQTVSHDTQYSIGQYAQDAIDLCKAKGVGQAFVIGYSDGGNIALHLACKAPELFPKIVAISPNYLASGTVDGWLKVFKVVAGTMRFLHRLGLPTKQVVMRFDLMLNDIGLTAEDLGSVRTNLRILYAEKDMIKESHILEMGRLIPGATVVQIAHCNHMTILNKPDAVEDMKRYLLATT